jgi:DNA polymerase
MNEAHENTAARVERYLRQQYELYGEPVLDNERVFGTTIDEPTGAAANASVGETGAGAFMSLLESIDEPWVTATSLDSLNSQIEGCRKCPLWKTRNRFVFGEGNPQADLVVIGEAPGADEDAQGRPFVGAAGKLLTKILAAVDFDRDDVFICNILKSRPPNNRRPEREEIDACIPYLYKQMALIQPRLVLALGLTAAKGLLGVSGPMRDLRGKLHDWNGIPVVVTYHPAALLRNPNWKRSTWEDVQMVRQLYDSESIELNQTV